MKGGWQLSLRLYMGEFEQWGMQEKCDNTL